MKIHTYIYRKSYLFHHFQRVNCSLFSTRQKIYPIIYQFYPVHSLNGSDDSQQSKMIAIKKTLLFQKSLEKECFISDKINLLYSLTIFQVVTRCFFSFLIRWQRIHRFFCLFDKYFTWFTSF